MTRKGIIYLSWREDPQVGADLWSKYAQGVRQSGIDIVELKPSVNYGSWSGARIEAFLTATRIPLRLSLNTKSGMLIVPIWFEYAVGHFLSCSPDDSLLVRSLRSDSAIAFDVSSNDLPYMGVRGRGVTECSTTEDNATLVRLLDRYTAGTDNNLADWLLNRSVAEALIDIRMTWLTSWDFSSRMANIQKISERHPGEAL